MPRTHPLRIFSFVSQQEQVPSLEQAEKKARIGNVELPSKNYPNGFMEVRLGGQVVGKIRHDKRELNIEFAKAFVAGTPLLNRHMDRATTRGGSCNNLTACRAGSTGRRTVRIQRLKSQSRPQRPRYWRKGKTS